MVGRLVGGRRGPDDCYVGGSGVLRRYLPVSIYVSCGLRTAM